jgi:5'-nucleotidase
MTAGAGNRVLKKEARMKRVLYVDMDNVLVDFKSAFKYVSPQVLEKHRQDPDNIPGIFALMSPMPCAVESYHELAEKFETYILSTAPWNNPSAWSDKLAWVKNYLGAPVHKRLVITHHKNLLRGDFLIDDQKKNGAEHFEGQLIQFGSELFPDWAAVMQYLRERVHPEV